MSNLLQLDTDQEFHNKIGVATTNLRDVTDQIQNAWLSYLAIMIEPQLSGFDVLGAVNTAIGLIPGVGGFLSAAIDLADKGSHWGASSPSAHVRSVKQLKAIDERINKRIDWYNGQNAAYKNADEAGKTRILQETFPDGVIELTSDQKQKISYVVEYELFKRYCERHVVVVRTIQDNLIAPDSIGEWSVEEGLNDAQQSYVFETFGGGKHFDYGKAFRLLAKYSCGRSERDYLKSVKAGMELIGMQLRPVRSPYMLILNWGAKKREFVYSKIGFIHNVYAR